MLSKAMRQYNLASAASHRSSSLREERGDTLSHADSRAFGGVGGGTMTEDTTSQASLLVLCSVYQVIHLSFKSKPQ